MDIKKLLNTLTIEEKIGQMLQIAPFFFIKNLEIEVAGNVNDLALNEAKIFRAGSVLGIRNASEMIEVQKNYLKKSRHQIPLMFMADVIHGYETIFPVPLSLSTSWNPKLAYDMARVSAIEASTAGLHVTFSPMADLSRDPRWGRVVEGFGEDPYLNQIFTKSIVEGYQQDDISKDGNIAACVKHFAAYGASESGRDYNTVDMSRLSMHNDYFTGYKAAVDAGAHLIMTSFNVLDGIPATVNKYLLKDVLRKSWGFKGVTISDYDSLHQIIEHGCAEDDKEAAIRGIEAGLDIEMASSCYTNYLKKLVENQTVDIKLIDQAVYRILKLKKEIGLFDNPFKGASIEQEEKLVRSKNHLQRAKEAALESAVLLKNDGILPLNKKLKYVLIGPYAESTLTNGPWSWHGRNNLNHQLSELLVEQGISLILTKEVSHPSDLSDSDIKLVREADVIILALGEHEKESGEAHSRSDIRLPRKQESFVTFSEFMNKKSMVLLYHGRPLDLGNIMQTNAILDVYFLGSMANDAIADLMTGVKNPSGKLTMSYPRNVGQIPIYYNQLNTGRPKVEGSHNEYVSYYLDVENSPLFPFGYGLSYSNFKYSELSISKDSITVNEKLKVRIDVENTTNTPGYETIQLYIRDYSATISRPLKQLKGFKKVWFDQHEKKTIEFELSKNDLSFMNGEGQTVLETGRFAVMIGSNSETLTKMDFHLVKEVVK
jgi:beta-glucosidase